MPSDKIQLGGGGRIHPKAVRESQSIRWANHHHPPPFPKKKLLMVELMILGSMYFVAYGPVCGDALRC